MSLLDRTALYLKDLVLSLRGSLEPLLLLKLQITLVSKECLLFALADSLCVLEWSQAASSLWQLYE